MVEYYTLANQILFHLERARFEHFRNFHAVIVYKTKLLSVIIMRVIDQVIVYSRVTINNVR